MQRTSAIIVGVIDRLRTMVQQPTVGGDREALREVRGALSEVLGYGHFRGAGDTCVTAHNMVGSGTVGDKLLCFIRALQYSPWLNDPLTSVKYATRDKTKADRQCQNEDKTPFTCACMCPTP